MTMKTFKQFLAEERKIEMFSDLIFQHCRPFLEASGGKGFLLRGIKRLSEVEAHSVLDAEGEEMEYAVKTVRQDRRPLDITGFRSRVIDGWFDEKFGIKARSQCVFAGGNKMEVKDLKHYGTPCAIFPIGEFKYVWSQEVEDVFGDMNVFANTEDELEEKIRDWFDRRNYQTDGLDLAVQLSKEIMIKCDRYYAFPLEYQDKMKQALGFK